MRARRACGRPKRRAKPFSFGPAQSAQLSGFQDQELQGQQPGPANKQPSLKGSSQAGPRILVSGGRWEEWRWGQ